ncbi:MAG: NAD-dependent epimerase/dehydratase family protein [Lachnospiraceae bacterium]|nr:NAD-dependent epimerase/dehydratase family protein [Lachnospiraceae bacterium]
MKRILITGTGSYIGNAVEQYLMTFNAREGREIYRVDKVSLRDASWENMNFGEYDSVLHVAGIAHADVGKVSEETKALYYEVNCNLTLRVAQKCAAEGVGQFIYLSSIIVYGDSAGVGKKRHITIETQPQPVNFYGDSKWQAEQKLQKLDASLSIAIVRPPMVYGKGSKGNFPLLVRLAERAPFFPSIHNERSMIYVENLAEFLRLLIESGEGGIYLPQNTEYTTTTQMVKAIAAAKGRTLPLWAILNPFVRLASVMPGKIGGLANKAFGSLTIDYDLSDKEITGYCIYSLEESVKRSLL